MNNKQNIPFRYYSLVKIDILEKYYRKGTMLEAGSVRNCS